MEPRQQPPLRQPDRFDGIGDVTVATVARQLSDYWLVHPLACDTPIGIREWWLTGPVTDKTVRLALHALTDWGVVMRDAVGEGQVERYRLAMSSDEFRQWLMQDLDVVRSGRSDTPH